MNLVLFGKNLPRKKKLIYALKLLYGIGLFRSKKICRDLGLPPEISIKNLTEFQKFTIAEKIKNEFVVEGKLEEQIKENINYYKSNGSIRGYRLRTGLPIRGQRTRTNAKTARRLNHK
jgi:small subunit ribosomal protein S13